MRIAVISDIHGNMTALQAVVADLKIVSVDVVVHGGDLAANGSRPCEVIDFIRDAGWCGVRGNTDEMLWRPELLEQLIRAQPSRSGLRHVLFNEIAPATRELIGNDRLNWLKNQPTEWRTHGIVVTHASPGDLWRAPLEHASDDELISVFGPLQAATVAYGHIHRSFVRRPGSRVIANSGSVSLSYDGDPRAAYIICDDAGVTIRRVEYDVEHEIKELQASRYPRRDWLSSILKSGKYTAPF